MRSLEEVGLTVLARRAGPKDESHKVRRLFSNTMSFFETNDAGHTARGELSPVAKQTFLPTASI